MKRITRTTEKTAADGPPNASLQAPAWVPSLVESPVERAQGAVIGAVAGTTAALVQKGEKVNVLSDTLLQFRLKQPASLPK